MNVMDVPVNKILEGNVMDILPQIPTGTFNMICTSPPYWGLRAYQTQPVIWGGQKDCRHKWVEHTQKPKGGMPLKESTIGMIKQLQKDPSFTGLAGGMSYKSNFCQSCSAWRGELGLEPTPELYIEHLMMVFDECKRVLRPDGICFVNIGDSYASHPAKSKNVGGFDGRNMDKNPEYKDARIIGKQSGHGVKDKSLCAIPERFVIAMMDRDWIRRCTIIWAKGLSFCENYSGSCMPDSAKDRPNHNGFEYVYMFTKSKKYWYEQQYEEAEYDGRHDTKLKPTDMYSGRNFTPQKMQREPMERWPIKITRKRSNPRTKICNERGGSPNDYAGQLVDVNGEQVCGRTIRNVWAINPQAFSEAHFATFPEKLVEPLIKMGCPEFVCKKCGKPRSKVYKSDSPKDKEQWPATWGNRGFIGEKHIGSHTHNITEHIEIGLTDCGCKCDVCSKIYCDCGKKYISGIVLDPFMGSGRVALVAYKNRRDYCGIELQPDYVKMSEKALTHAQEQFGLIEGVK